MQASMPGTRESGIMALTPVAWTVTGRAPFILAGALWLLAGALSLVAGALAGSVPSAWAQEPTRDWKTYTFADDGFAVDLPAAPDIVAERPTGQIRSSRQYQLEMGLGSYVVSATRYAAGANLGQWNNDSMVELANAMKGKCRIRDGRPGAFAGALSYEMVLDQCPDGAVMKVRMYVVGEWVYQAVAVGPPGVDAKPETQKFQDSFKLVQLSRPPADEDDQPAVKPKKGSSREARDRDDEHRASHHGKRSKRARGSRRRRH